MSLLALVCSPTRRVYVNGRVCGQRKENLICSSCPRTFHSALFLSWVKSRKRCYFLLLSLTPRGVRLSGKRRSGRRKTGGWPASDRLAEDQIFPCAHSHPNWLSTHCTHALFPFGHTLLGHSLYTRTRKRHKGAECRESEKNWTMITSRQYWHKSLWWPPKTCCHWLLLTGVCDRWNEIWDKDLLPELSLGCSAQSRSKRPLLEISSSWTDYLCSSWRREENQNIIIHF